MAQPPGLRTRKASRSSWRRSTSKAAIPFWTQLITSKEPSLKARSLASMRTRRTLGTAASRCRARARLAAAVSMPTTKAARDHEGGPSGEMGERAAVAAAQVEKDLRGSETSHDELDLGIEVLLHSRGAELVAALERLSGQPCVVVVGHVDTAVGPGPSMRSLYLPGGGRGVLRSSHSRVGRWSAPRAERLHIGSRGCGAVSRSQGVRAGSGDLPQIRSRSAPERNYAAPRPARGSSRA